MNGLWNEYIKSEKILILVSDKFLDFPLPKYGIVTKLEYNCTRGLGLVCKEIYQGI